MRMVAEWQKVVHARNVEKGFYDYKKDLLALGDCLADDAPFELRHREALIRVLKDYSKLQIERKLLLAIGEICEAHEELRSGHAPTDIYQNEGSHKPEGFGIELADAHIRLLDVAAATGVDQEMCMTEKHDYNGTRPHKHGKQF